MSSPGNFTLPADMSTARCPLCSSPVMCIQGIEEYVMFPSRLITDDLFGDGRGIDVTEYPHSIVSQFRATFAPCGCIWEGADRNGLLPFLLLIEANEDAVQRLSLIDRGLPGFAHYMYIIRAAERTNDGQV